MLKKIYAPLAGTVTDMQVTRYDRIRRSQTLLQLKAGETLTPIVASYDGWVRHVFIKSEQAVTTGQVLFIIDVVDINDFQPDSTEVNPHTELGEAGRRGLERQGQRSFGHPAGPLFDAPEASNGMGHRGSVKPHPHLIGMKEGTPNKMSANAATNKTAIEQTADNATHDPELAKQLSQQLQQRLQIGSALHKSPTLSR
ncbi:acetyl-CoA carboxylase biotin carboxyl carrier protein subunit [Coxiella burnetii]|uniref:Lipoyl-binding domain-containing protein n=3 Tax=Coxiella burnetii TaxID=777 RepID=Q83C43_COXBU|nr:biotin/lipoyl-binding protein [Coxiella burnetii]NP_820283.1 hypothetical protein CBU_1291 [Coxiella burnetii RSA 493]AAO90797.1 hypothetical protein CBU_1291 [Coxiella burnetii RSA 493]ABS77991.1 hypothetical protein CBUD_1379 [Coxiella burnetii Dugway 5J108-111]ABX78294.1 putative biotin-requiring enzyme subunit [Coxiella burnetii RSA 331]ACJ20347.1 hypothetical protein CbuK_1154 [Coxiella burnetii CbuK_Q154]AIT63412.1 Putative biotin-requiring enzyme subunit [Coxiella burnetii str. Nami